MAKKAEKKEFHKAPYNPRSMGAQAKRALKKSLETFSDISGIVVNETTGNILGGNHRWEQLCNIYGESNLGIVHLSGEFHQIMSGEKFTGFLMRVVKWEIEKEKAANVAANSPMIAGEFTSGLQDILNEVQDFLGDDFEEMRMDDLSIDFGDLEGMGRGGISDTESLSDKIRKSAEDDNVMLDTEENQSGDVRIIKTSIKILVPGDKADMIREDIIEYLSERPYYKELEIS